MAVSVTWEAIVKQIEIGARVRYTRAFLRSTGMYTGDIPFARGTVVSLETLGGDCTLARIDWGDPDIPKRVNVCNLEALPVVPLL